MDCPASSTPEGAARRLNHLGFVETSVHSVVDGSCQALDAGLDAAVRYSGDTCRPRAEDFKQRTSGLAKRTAYAAKQSTADALRKLDPTVRMRFVLRAMVIYCFLNLFWAFAWVSAPLIGIILHEGGSRPRFRPRNDGHGMCLESFLSALHKVSPLSSLTPITCRRRTCLTESIRQQTVLPPTPEVRPLLDHFLTQEVYQCRFLPSGYVLRVWLAKL